MRKIVTLIIVPFVAGITATAQGKLQPDIDKVPATVCESTLCNVTPVQPPVQSSVGQEVSGFFSSILDTSKWPERWHCGIWTPLHGWTYILSDFFIWLSYFAIPLILGYFVYKKGFDGQIPFKSVLILFIVFILACGLTHLMDAAIFWWPAYKLSTLLRLGTAIVSMFTVFSLIRVVPDVLELKSPAFLESQVDSRTKELQTVNEQLKNEMIQRKKASDHLHATNQELMAFSYSVSHDLRSPLRSIHGFSHALLEDYSPKLDAEGKDYLERICSASSRMGELIDDMLKLAKISRNEIDASDMDLSQLIQEVVATSLQQNPGTKAHFKIAKGIRANADYKLIRIAMENLIDNAIKYSSKASSPSVEFGRTTDGSFFVRDNGAGFDMQFADKLFGAFQRLHEGEFDGSGIGLATVKRIIVKHGGNIWAEAKVNEGATFYFTINEKPVIPTLV